VNLSHTTIALAAASVCAVLVGCATSPPETDSAPESGPVAAGDAPAKRQPTSDTAAAAGSSRRVPSGYRHLKHDGRDLYCRTVTTIGTRFTEQICFTRKQLDEIAERTDNTMDDIEQSMKTCSNPSCSGGG
jgi:hypothetical protein